MNKPILYLSKTCKQCKRIRRLLDSLDIEHDDRNVINVREYKHELLDRGYFGVPLLVIDDVEIAGYDEDKIIEALKNKGFM